MSLEIIKVELPLSLPACCAKGTTEEMGERVGMAEGASPRWSRQERR